MMIDVKLTKKERKRLDFQMALALIKQLEIDGQISSKTMDKIEKIAKKELEKDR